MKILGIDPSSTVLGYVVLEDDSLLDYGIISTARVDYDRRFMYLIEELGKVVRKHGIDQVACERAIRFEDKRVPALEIAVLSIKKYCQKVKLPISFYSPAEWKKSAIGDARADKQAVARIIVLSYPQLVDTADHVTDACGIALHHAGVLRWQAMEAKRA